MPLKDPVARSTYQREYRAKIADKAREYMARYYQENRPEMRRQSDEWKHRHPAYMSDYLRRYGLKQKYGITVEQYNEMFDAQDGVCAICGQPPRGKALHVDHCHATGVNRGLLCLRCNAAMERLDTIEGWAGKAAAYKIKRPR